LNYGRNITLKLSIYFW